MKKLSPDYIFETSWEVCNKVGGIYTVLSTKAKTLVSEYGNNRVIFIGPYLNDENHSSDFEKSDEYADFENYVLNQHNIRVKVGRWIVNGEPLAILIDYSTCFINKNSIYKAMWDDFKVDSLHAYGDYDDSSMFGYASGIVISSFCNFYQLNSNKVCAHFNEWMTSFGLLYLKKNYPNISTLFTTHATTVGRSISGNGKPLYDYMSGYNGDQMAFELNVQSKHSAEKAAAHFADCFTVVSDITNRECLQLLEKSADVVTPNGFDIDIVPDAVNFRKKRLKARNKLISVANSLYGCQFDKDTFIVATSGRYEFRNKGLDLYIDAIRNLANKKPEKNILAFIFVPAWVKGPREELVVKLNNKNLCSGKMEYAYITHELMDKNNDQICNMIEHNSMLYQDDSNVKLIFVPTYLNGKDGVLGMGYYDILCGLDLTVFPSYYEPWGYTPLESIAFGIPTITTNLSGFGIWFMKKCNKITDGIGIVNRNDSNFTECSYIISEMISEYFSSDSKTKINIRKKAKSLSKEAQWKDFIKYYYSAYEFALNKKVKNIHQ